MAYAIASNPKGGVILNTGKTYSGSYKSPSGFTYTNVPKKTVQPTQQVTTSQPQQQQVQQPQQSGGQQQDIDWEAYQREQERLQNEQINAAYDPAYQNLNRVEADYKQQYPTAQQEVEQSYSSMLPGDRKSV